MKAKKKIEASEFDGHAIQKHRIENVRKRRESEVRKKNCMDSIVTPKHLNTLFYGFDKCSTTTTTTVAATIKKCSASSQPCLLSSLLLSRIRQFRLLTADDSLYYAPAPICCHSTHIHFIHVSIPGQLLKLAEPSFSHNRFSMPLSPTFVFYWNQDDQWE